MKQITAYIILFVALFLFDACKKDLNKLPENSQVQDVVVTDAKTAETALNGAYYSFANATAIKTDWRSHERFPGMFGGYLGYGFGPSPEEENNYDGDYYWTESYKLLNNVNGVIEGVNKVHANAFAGNRKNEILGELFFLRAYAHFKLLSYYAEWFDYNSKLGVLIRDKSTTVSNISKPRSSVKDSYTFILNDLDYAIANAPSENKKYYASKWAGILLKMRVLMSRGQSADYATVVSLGDNIIQDSPYALEDSVKDIFRTKGLASNEVMLGLKPQLNQENDFYSRSAEYWPSASGLYVAKQKLKNLLFNDPRGSWVIGSQSRYIVYSPDTYYFTKYMVENSTPSQITETYYAMRLSEVYLLRAEAIVRSGGNFTNAKNDVKLLMTHAGVTDFAAIDNANTPADLLLQIYYETVRSLIGEDGQEWMALLRLDFATVKQIQPTITSKIRYILPIPHSEFVYNPAIGDQNPGYNK